MPRPVTATGNAQQAARSASAERVRESRARRKRHERVVPVEVRDTEIVALIARGFLADDRKDDPRAIGHAVGKLLDRIPPKWWPMV